MEKRKKKQREKKLKYPIKNNPKPILFIIDPGQPQRFNP